MFAVEIERRLGPRDDCPHVSHVIADEAALDYARLVA